MEDSRRRAAALMNRLRTDGFEALHSSDSSAGIPRSAQRGFGLVLDAATMTITEVRECVSVSGTVRVRVRVRVCECVYDAFICDGLLCTRNCKKRVCIT